MHSPKIVVKVTTNYAKRKFESMLIGGVNDF